MIASSQERKPASVTSQGGKALLTKQKNPRPETKTMEKTREVVAPKKQTQVVKENIINPIRLLYAIKQEANKPHEEKYNCYFAFSKHLYHRYILTMNRKIIIVTIIKINRDWQKAIG